MEQAHSEVNVEEIMAEIRRKVQMEEDLKNLPTFEDIPVQGMSIVEENRPVEAVHEEQIDWAVLQESLTYVNTHYDIPYYWPFSGGTVKVFFKRVVRKLAKCLLAPIVQMQNTMNAFFVRCVNNLRHGVRELFARTDRQAEELAIVKRTLAAHEEDFTALRRALSDQESAQAEEFAAVKQMLAVQAEEFAALQQAMSVLAETQENRLAQMETAWAKETDILKAGFSEQGEQLQISGQRLDEIKGMIDVNAGGIRTLEKDMDCLRRLDGTIFTRNGILDYNKYSQAGEDSIIAYILVSLGYREDEATYLDIGANHAKHFSNTYYFYKRGASGVLVEANPGLIPELRLNRSRDVILNKCVSASDGDEVDFYVLNHDGLSTSDPDSVAHACEVNQDVAVSFIKRVGTITVSRILKDYFAQPPMILNVDIEGGEMDVLNALDYERGRPLIIVVETIPYENGLTIGKKNEEIVSALTEKGYVEYAFTGINSIFLDEAQARRINRNIRRIYDGPMDCYQFMLTNELAYRRFQGICLEPGGMAYGPYITLPAGEYSLEVRIVKPEVDAQVNIEVTGDMGQKHFASFALAEGTSRLYFSIPEEEKNVEFVVRNNSDADVMLQRVKLN